MAAASFGPAEKAEVIGTLFSPVVLAGVDCSHPYGAAAAVHHAAGSRCLGFRSRSRWEPGHGNARYRRNPRR